MVESREKGIKLWKKINRRRCFGGLIWMGVLSLLLLGSTFAKGEELSSTSTLETRIEIQSMEDTPYKDEAGHVLFGKIAQDSRVPFKVYLQSQSGIKNVEIALRNAKGEVVNQQAYAPEQFTSENGFLLVTKENIQASPLRCLKLEKEIWVTEEGAGLQLEVRMRTYEEQELVECFELSIDKTPPMLNLTGPDKELVNAKIFRGKVQIELDILEEHFSEQLISLKVYRNGELCQDIRQEQYRSTVEAGKRHHRAPLNIEQDGNYKIQVEGQDQSGHLLEPRSVEFQLDCKPPKVELLHTKPGFIGGRGEKWFKTLPMVKLEVQEEDSYL